MHAKNLQLLVKCSHPSVLCGKEGRPSKLLLGSPLALNEMDKIIKNSYFMEFKLKPANSKSNFLGFPITLATRCISSVQIL